MSEQRAQLALSSLYPSSTKPARVALQVRRTGAQEPSQDDSFQEGLSQVACRQIHSLVVAITLPDGRRLCSAQCPGCGFLGKWPCVEVPWDAGVIITHPASSPRTTTVTRAPRPL